MLLAPSPLHAIPDRSQIVKWSHETKKLTLQAGECLAGHSLLSFSIDSSITLIRIAPSLSLEQNDLWGISLKNSPWLAQRQSDLLQLLEEKDEVDAAIFFYHLLNHPHYHKDKGNLYKEVLPFLQEAAIIIPGAYIRSVITGTRPHLQTVS